MSGKTPTFSDSLKIILRGSQICTAASFSIFAGILSGPGDLESFSPLSAVCTYCLVTGMSLNLTNSSLLDIKGVRSSFNLPSILPANEGPTLVKCLLKEDIISLLCVSCLFSNSIIETIVKSCPNGETCGIDGVSYEDVKAVWDKHGDTLVNVLNISLTLFHMGGVFDPPN